jgi:hypothetical protein
VWKTARGASDAEEGERYLYGLLDGEKNEHASIS